MFKPIIRKECNNCWFKLNHQKIERKKIPCDKCKDYSRWSATAPNSRKITDKKSMMR